MLGRSRVQSAALGSFAALALLAGLAAVVFSTHFLIRSQRKSIAIREALGGSGLHLFGFVVSPLLRALCAGIAAACLLFALAARIVTESTDVVLDISLKSAWLTLGSIGLAFLATTLIAILRRSRNNLADVLRQE